jgi:integrase
MFVLCSLCCIIVVAIDCLLLVVFQLKKKNMRLSLSNLQSVLQTDSSNTRTKPVPSPSAQSSKLLQTGSDLVSHYSELAYSLFRSNKQPRVLLAVLELLLGHGLRISEVLNIRPRDISASGHIRIVGLKGSRDRIVHPVLYRQFWLESRVGDLPVLFDYSRFWFYRKFKELGFSHRFANGTNLSVTHLFRHLNALSINTMFGIIELTQNHLGHKSQSSTRHYVKE